ncbi:hypothetical protein IFR05_014287 [Cadophora sp. M221]|nr:hypothetical protein IFR05_014287 [Cadophora sp. M221]
MRLRVTVRRHALPETPILWSIDTNTSPTVYQLLEQINEVVPIESDGQWGLEDYAVELKGANGANYECLHFHPVESVLKEEDEVIIRPLLTQDLKVRRISGRHQISDDGKRLYDGLALGRPLLRTPNRPAINIPPRKKRRITYNADEEDDEGFAALQEADDAEGMAQQLLLGADLDDEDSEDDEDFAPAEDDSGSDEDNENKQLVVHANAEDDDSEHDEDFAPEPEDDDDSDSDNSEEDGDNKQLVVHAEFDNADTDSDEDVVLEEGADEEQQADDFEQFEDEDVLPKEDVDGEQQSDTIHVDPTTEMEDQDANDLDELALRSISDPETRAKIRSIQSGKALSFMAEAARSSPAPDPTSAGSTSESRLIKFPVEEEEFSNGLTSTPVIDKESQQVESSDDDSDSDDSSDEDSSSSSDSSDSSSEDEKMADVAASASSSSESSSDSSSDLSSEDDDAPEVESSKTKPSSTKAEPIPKPRPQPREGQGKSSTKSRNRRRRNANLLDRYKNREILPAGTTLAELSQLKLNAKSTPEEAMAALEELRASKVLKEVDENASIRSQASEVPDQQTNAAQQEFERRRAELLSSLANGGVEVGLETLKKDRKSATPAQTPKPPLAQASPIPVIEQNATSLSAETETGKPSLISQNVSKLTSKMSENEDPRSSTGLESPIELDTPSQAPKPQPVSESSSQTAPRRSRLDLGAGRRMLFGALGLKTPKSKTDEEKLKKDLMKDVKPLTTPKPVEPEVVEKEVDEDPDAWRNKIVYRAVECVQDDVLELSEPPFPFVQRWDPQQQGTRSHKGKRKKNQQDQTLQYDEEPRASKKQKRRKGKHTYTEEQEYLEASYEPSYQEDSVMDSQFDDSIQNSAQNRNEDEDINQQFVNDTQAPAEQDGHAEPDLPVLPQDLSTLPALHNGTAKVGMIIAFKRLEMSSNWQPLLSDYVTAEVTFVPEKGELGLLLAKRDRKITEKTYDQNTGDRIYAGFDAPDDDEMDEEAEGQLFLEYGQLVEPKILQQAPIGPEEESQEGQANFEHGSDMNNRPESNQADPIIIDDDAPTKEVRSADESTILSHDQELPESNEEELPEAQYSHVTETPINSDAPESYQQDRQPSLDLEMSELSPQNSLDEETDSRNSHAELPKSSQQIGAVSLQAGDSVSGSREVNELQAEASFPQETPSTPALRGKGNEESPLDIDYMNESVPEETRQKVTRMMQDAGFRSNVPSSILRGPDEIQTPGEVASFEKLRKEMSGIETNGNKESNADKENQSQAYSPKFNGLGSSPIRKPRESSRTPTKPPQLASRSSSPTRPPSSSWETVDGVIRSSPPPQPSQEQEDEGHSSWVTVDQTQTEAQPSRPPAFELALALEKVRPLSPSAPAQPATSQALGQTKPQSSPTKPAKTGSGKPENPTPAKKVPIGKAQAYWEQWQARKRRRSNDSDSEYEDAKTSARSSTKTSPERSAKSTEEKDADTSVKYPKLSLGSSFTSQVTDHGRQPDFDDTAMTMDSPSIPNLEADNPLNRSPQPDLENGQRLNGKGKGRASETATDAELPPTKETTQAPIKMPEVPSDDSSDDELPSLEALSQREKFEPLKSKKSVKVDADYKKAMAALDEESSEDQTTPKASQKQRQASNSKSSKSRASENHALEKPASQSSRSRASERPASHSRTSVPRASQPRASQPIPAGSHFMDLTLSSDAEPEVEPTPPLNKPFRKYNLNSDDDDDFEGSPGWVPKNGNTVTDVAPRRQTSVSLRSSSHTTLNARNRRQTTNK